MAEISAPLLEIRGLTRRFLGVTALKGVDLTADAGEIHALVGANGAGKSTLMNLLSGVIQPSAGEILLQGESARLSSPAAAQERGVSTVYQEFSLVPQLSVARNIFLGREPRGRFGLVDQLRLNVDARDLLRRFKLTLDPQQEVSRLSVAEQQLVEIARALSFSARIVILDEPTAVLSLAEQENLFEIIRQLRNEGLLVLYVSHHLEEVLALADRVTILRDGEKVATREVPELSIDELVALMIGRSGAWSGSAPATAHEGADYRVTYRSNTGVSRVTIGCGEIVGIAGLVGAGRTTFGKALAGSSRVTSSVDLAHGDTAMRFASPRAAMRAGVVYLTEDRKRDGIFANLHVIANATASALPQISHGPIRSHRRERRLASDLLSRLRLVAANPVQPVAKLSGGNQQKVVLARALLTGPKLIVFDEPTRGVDVGAKAEIHEILRELARSGVAVFVISSEVEELIAISHRIVVMRDRQFIAEFPAEAVDEAAILLAASSGPSNSKGAAEP